MLNHHIQENGEAAAPKNLEMAMVLRLILGVIGKNIQKNIDNKVSMC